MVWTCASEACLKAPLTPSNAKLVSYCIIMCFSSSPWHAKQIGEVVEANCLVKNVLRSWKCFLRKGSLNNGEMAGPEVKMFFFSVRGGSFPIDMKGQVPFKMGSL